MKNTLQVGAIILLTFLLGACTNNNEPTVDAKPVPRPVEDTLVGFKGCDKTSFHPLSAYTFDFKYPNYVVRVMERSDTSGIGITVAPLYGGPHYNIMPPPNGTFAGINRDILYIDVGTSPVNRQVIMHDLRGQKEIIQFEYIGDAMIAGDGKFWYYAPVDSSEIEEKYLPDCPEKEDWIAKGFGVIYGRRKTFNPNNRVHIGKSEFSCFPNQ